MLRKQKWKRVPWHQPRRRARPLGLPTGCDPLRVRPPCAAHEPHHQRRTRQAACLDPPLPSLDPRGRHERGRRDSGGHLRNGHCRARPRGAGGGRHAPSLAPAPLRRPFCRALDGGGTLGTRRHGATGNGVGGSRTERGGRGAGGGGGGCCCSSGGGDEGGTAGWL